MKKTIFVAFALIIFSFTPKEDKILNHNNHNRLYVYQSNNKEFLLDYFQQTMDTLRINIEGMSEAQMQYKPSQEQWSVSQCLEHIVLTEKMLLEMAMELMAKPANPARKDEVKITDAELINGMTDRSFKATAPKELHPEGKYTTPETALQELNNERGKIKKFIEQTSVEDLRNHISDSPFGPVDAYHSILYIAAHTARHTSQINELKADAGFPSN
jgi:hypothetical protein